MKMDSYSAGVNVIRMFLLVVSVNILGCKNNEVQVVNPKHKPTTWEWTKQPREYSINHFFVDTVYRKYFEHLHSSLVVTLSEEIMMTEIVEIDVYLSIDSLYSGHHYYYPANTYIDLPVRGSTEKYSQSQIDNLSKAKGRFTENIFQLLDPSRDYKYDRFGGYITLLIPFKDSQVIAVAYTIIGETYINKSYGGYVAGYDSTLFLKLVKPENLIPNYKPAWDLMLKNFYSFKNMSMNVEDFSLRILRNTPNGSVDNIYGYNLLNVLGLDQYDKWNRPDLDNNFDFIPGLTVDPKQGEIIFPTLRPFDSTIIQYFRNRQITVSDSLLISEVYDTTSIAAFGNIHNWYVIIAKSIQR
jgi:hypothetical protein